MKFIFYLSTLFSLKTVVDFGSSYKTFVKGSKLNIEEGRVIIKNNSDIDVFKKLTNIKCITFGFEKECNNLKDKLKGLIFKNNVNNEKGTFIIFNIEDFTYEYNKIYTLEFEDKNSGELISLDIEICTLEQLKSDLGYTTLKENNESKDLNSKDVSSRKKESKAETLDEEDSDSVSSSIFSKRSSSREVSKGNKKVASSRKNVKNSSERRKGNITPCSNLYSNSNNSKCKELVIGLVALFVFAFIIFLLCCVPIMSIIKSLF